ncbi:MAG: hypothetical protein KDD47_16715 [Acidobacteria bacterium]|nr:hypothetical protein [Acidobacteriota bacterium]
MEKSRSAQCDQHGLQPATFVCQHIAASLVSRKPVGFFWPAEATEERPDAWCFACNERVKLTGGEWAGEAEASLGVRLLCGACYDDARALNFPR